MTSVKSTALIGVPLCGQAITILDGWALRAYPVKKKESTDNAWATLAITKANHYCCFFVNDAWYFLCTGVQECAGTDHQLCLRDVLSPAPSSTHPVHIWPHGVLPQYQWPHRLCYSGKDTFMTNVFSMSTVSSNLYSTFSILILISFHHSSCWYSWSPNVKDETNNKHNANNRASTNIQKENEYKNQAKIN